MSDTRVTMRDVAKAVGCSIYTVSSALNNSGRLSASVRSQIQEEAQRLGYRINPYISSAMAMARGGAAKGEVGTIGILNTDPEIEPRFKKQFESSYDSMLDGAQRRAETLGFRTEIFWLDRAGMTLGRLNHVLQSRGIQGVLMLPNCRYQQLCTFPWEHYSCVRLFPRHTGPRLHTVGIDFHRAVQSATDELSRHGYRKPGLFVEEFRDEIIGKRWSSAFIAMQMRLPQRFRVPVFVDERIEKRKFLAWFKKHQPDVLVGHCQDVLAWLADADCKIPGDVGYFSLNRRLTSGNCSGLDHKPNEVGAIGIDMVAGQLYRNERGVPTVPQTVLIDADYVEGTSLVRYQ